MGEKEFDLDYHFNSLKNPQTYDIKGTIHEDKDWRVVRLKVRAHEPWTSPWVLVPMVVALGFRVYLDDASPAAAIGVLAFVMGMYAVVNLWYIPSTVASRVANLLARRMRGSILEHSGWVVPDPD